MWYRTAKENLREAQGVGGGVIIKPKHPMLNNPQWQPGAAETHSNMDASLWENMIQQNDHIGNRRGETNETADPSTDGEAPPSEGPATTGMQARRLSPFHDNPEMTTMEAQLETVRQHGLNKDPNPDPNMSMSSTEDARGEMTIRNMPAYSDGKGWTGFKNHPMNTQPAR